MAKSEVDSVCCACNHDYTTQRHQMHEDQTRGTAQVSQRRMQLAKNSLTSQREDTAAEQRKHARLEDLHGLSYPSSQDLQRHCIYQTASRLTAPWSETTQTSALQMQTTFWWQSTWHLTQQQQTRQVSGCDVVITSTGAKQRLAPLSTFTHNVFVHHSKSVTLL